MSLKYICFFPPSSLGEVTEGHVGQRRHSRKRKIIFEKKNALKRYIPGTTETREGAVGSTSRDQSGYS